MAKKAIAATAAKPVSAVHSTSADTPRRSSTMISALTGINWGRHAAAGALRRHRITLADTVTVRRTKRWSSQATSG